MLTKVLVTALKTLLLPNINKWYIMDKSVIESEMQNLFDQPFNFSHY